METMYFHSAPDAKRGRVTVAGVVVDGALRFGAAMCSHRDAFVKKHGRNMAAGRALSSKYAIQAVALDRKPNELSLGQWFKQMAIAISETVLNRTLWANPLRMQEAENVLKKRAAHNMKQTKRYGNERKFD
jgi:hypothetical protein